MSNDQFCPKCGTKFNENAKFCEKCGYDLRQKSVSVGNDSTSGSIKPTSSSDVNTRLDLMMQWVTNNWATVAIMVLGLLVISLVMKLVFGYALLGLVALIAVTGWLYSYAWTNGARTTNFENQLHQLVHSVPATVTTAPQPMKAQNINQTTTQAGAAQPAEPEQPKQPNN